MCCKSVIVLESHLFEFYGRCASKPSKKVFGRDANLNPEGETAQLPSTAKADNHSITLILQNSYYITPNLQDNPISREFLLDLIMNTACKFWKSACVCEMTGIYLYEIRCKAWARCQCRVAYDVHVLEISETMTSAVHKIQASRQCPCESVGYLFYYPRVELSGRCHYLLPSL